MDALIHSENDAMATPSLKVMETYQLYGNMLTLTGLSEENANIERSIQMDAPTNLESVSGSIQVKGSMPVTPFENTLRYRFYDANGKVLSEGPFAVKSEDVGKPATFDNTLMLPALSSGSKFRLELADLSAKDGTPLSMTSAELVMK